MATGDVRRAAQRRSRRGIQEWAWNPATPAGSVGEQSHHRLTIAAPASALIHARDAHVI